MILIHIIYIVTMEEEGGIFQVVQDETLGRHLVATADIPQGTLIIKEKPIGIVYTFEN